jgi:hypothetical protein
MNATDNIVSRELHLAEQEEKLGKFKTDLKKKQFIEEIKNGLKVEIMKNPSGVKIIKKPFWRRVKEKLQNFLTKF